MYHCAPIRHCWLVMVMIMLAGANTKGWTDYEPVPLLTVTVEDQADVQALIDSELDVADVRPLAEGFEVDIVVHPQDRPTLQTWLASPTMDGTSLPFRVRVPDLLAAAAAVAAEYRDLADYNSEMQALATTYPNRVRLVTLGASVEGRAIRVLEMTYPISSQNGRAETAFLGLHHAREWPSGEMVMNLAHDLAAKYGSDERITALLNATRVWLVPVVNPDGLVYSRTVDATWRKNRRHNSDGSWGVDNNRNYAYRWGGGGSSSSGNSPTYRGTAPFSEPETRAVAGLFRKHHMITAVSNHTYGKQNAYPWGYTTADAPEVSLLASLATTMKSYNGYTVGSFGDIIHVGSGIADDWAYGLFRGLFYTLEHASVYQPSYDTVQSLYVKNYPAFLYLAEQARARASILQGSVTNAVTHAGILATLSLSRGYSVPSSLQPTTDSKKTTMKTSSSGSYKWYVLPSKAALEAADPGYTFTVAASGYTTKVVSGVKIGRGATKTLNVVLSPVNPAAFPAEEVAEKELEVR
jgi:carboxypeptidase T